MEHASQSESDMKADTSHTCLSHTRVRGRSRAHMVIVGSGVVVHGIVFIVFLLQCVTTSVAVELHVSRTDPRGMVIFNASLGQGWSYHIDHSKSKQSRPYLQLDSSSGLLYWMGVRGTCAIENPIIMHVVSRTWQLRSDSGSNISVVPYAVTVNGCEHLHRTVKYNRWKDNMVHEVVITSEQPSLDCIPPSAPFAALTEFIPITLHQCQIIVDLPVSSPVSVDPDTLTLSSAVTMCFVNNIMSVEFSVSVLCDQYQMFQMPYRLSILRQDKPFRLLNRRRRAINNRPVFKGADAQGKYTVHVKEELPPGKQIITITATDNDTEGAGTLTYSMVTNLDDRSQSMFAINPLTGTINTTVKLDREYMRIHHFYVIATDHGIPPMSATAELDIIVDDVNDHAPQFDQQVYNINLAENQDMGYPVLTVQASDVDFAQNAEIRYSIINSNNAFQINPTTGAISTLRTLDRETQDSYTLLIQAVDQGDIADRKSSTATVNITIIDENDNSPVFAQESYEVSIREDQAISIIQPIIRVTATDKDIGRNAQIQYQLSGNNPDKFSMNANTGEVFLTNPLDYDEIREYSLTIRADDQGVVPKRGMATLLVHVTDVNDNAPYFTSPSYHGIVTENSPTGFSIIQVQAFDRDSGVNSDLNYSFVSGGNNQTVPLAIDSKTGWIRTIGTIDRESTSEYSIIVQVADNGQPQKSASTTVVIKIRDVNDNPPIFTQRFYQANVSEEANIGNEVLRVVAVDSDEGENARVMYEISAGNVGNAFQMAQSNNEGLISVKKVLDARLQNRYTLTVTATDSGSLQDTVQVFITVTDTNRNPPQFPTTSFQFSVDENIAIGTSVYKVIATDPDQGENGRITYSLNPGVTAFSIDPNTGDISTRVKLDRESTQNYGMLVTATDNGNPQRKGSADIDVTINDENDNKPEFTETVYTGSVREYPVSLPGEKVLQITARDRDKGANGQVYYTFEGGSDGNGDFSIDSAMGIVRVAKPLDRERISNYELVALAFDRGTPQAQSSSVIIRIKIEDVNDNRPKFAADQLDVYITENSPIGSTVAHITATDDDEGVNALVEYSKDGGPDVDSFQLSGRRGEPAIITTLISLDYEGPKKRYELVLRASSGTQFSTTRVFVNVRDVNDNSPILQDFSIIYNNYAASFPNGPVGRIPAHDPDVTDQELLRFSILFGNEANLLHLNATTGEITLDSRLNSDVPRNGTFMVSASDGKNMVKATCRLFVRLVTPEMLHDSVTIRLNKMTETAFLSSLLKFFSDALATIFNTDPTNIFIINIENDTDVAPAQILNVSVSVRQGSISVQGRTQDVFFSPEYLMEYIYLYRSLLANLSALEVLPFDDNLCLVEPCPSFSVCLSMVRQGEARPFISSDSVLFRPIHPDNGYRCQCPHGFAGKTFANNCDVEVDLCYSMPCHNGGTCLPHESGYTCVCTADSTGQNCEVNMTMKYDVVTCPTEFCRRPSICVPLIKGGFRCDGCPDDGNYDDFCRLRTSSFRKGSYMTFPSLKTRNKFTIKLRFATQEPNGLLLYNGRFNEEHDFVGLEIVGGQVTFSFSTGSNRTAVSTYIEGGVSTGQWFEVAVEYHDKVATVTVGRYCDTNIAILYGAKLDNYTCAAQVSFTLPARCDNPTNDCHRLLDLTGPLQLGGLPWAPSTGQVTQQDFIGCISDVYVDDKLLDLNKSVVNIQTDVGCAQKKEYCRSSPCTMGGKCTDGWTTFSCDCPEKAGGKDCSEAIERSRQLRGNGYLSFTNLAQDSIPYATWYNGLSFRTRAGNGTLMQIILNTGLIRMRLSDGFVVYGYKNVSLALDSMRVNDGLWHFIEARWYQGRLELLLDYSQRQTSRTVTESVSGSNIQLVYVGGFRQGNNQISDGFIGCVKDVRVGNNPSAVLFNPTENNVQAGCSVPGSCDPNPCGSGTCEDLWGDHVCHCMPGKQAGPFSTTSTIRCLK